MSDRDPARYLSPMQFACAKLAAQHMTNEEIARELQISRRTVKAHLDNARHKLRLRTKRDVAHAIIDWGYLD